MYSYKSTGNSVLVVNTYLQLILIFFPKNSHVLLLSYVQETLC